MVARSQAGIVEHLGETRRAFVELSVAQRRTAAGHADRRPARVRRGDRDGMFARWVHGLSVPG